MIKYVFEPMYFLFSMAISIYCKTLNCVNFILFATPFSLQDTMQGLKCQRLNVLVCFKSSFHMHGVVHSNIVNV